MKHLAAIQAQLAINKGVIKYLEEDILYTRSIKSRADEDSNQALEFEAHNILKKLRAELKGYVKIQQALKQIAKGKF